MLDYTPPANKNSGTCHFNWDSFETESDTDGVLLNLVFTVPADAVSGETFNVWFTYNNGDVYDFDLNDVTLKMVGGKITVK